MTYTFKLSRRLAASWYHPSMLCLFLLVLGCSDRTPLEDSGLEEADFARSSTTLVVRPKQASMRVGEHVKFSATASTADTSPVAVVWSASGGSITTDGVFTANSSGTYRVTAKTKGRVRADTGTVSVASDSGAPPSPIDTVAPRDSTAPDTLRPAAPTPSAVVLAPDSASVVAGLKLTFRASVRNSDGSVSAVPVRYTATGGSIDASGVYVAGSIAGRYQVVATDSAGRLADTAVVRITAAPPTVTRIDLTPATVTLVAGASQTFAVSARMSDGSTAPATATFVATGGAVTVNGLYTAGTQAGIYRVIAATASGVADTSSITVPPPAGPSTTITPGQDIQASVNAFGQGTTFLLKAGVHRLQSVVPKSGDVFVGEPGAILSGARLLAPVREGSYWVATGQTQEGVVKGECQTQFPTCAQPEELYIDDVRLTPVASLSAVGAGRWFFDYAADKIYFADDPTNRRVETSVNSTAFSGLASNVTIRGLVVEKYASAAQAGAIAGDNGQAWVVENSEVRWNHGVGIRAGSNWRLSGNNIHHNGQLGIGSWKAANLVVENNEIAYNNVAGYSAYWEAGGTKFAASQSLVVRGNYVHHNKGKGLWTDIDNMNTLYENNRVIGNDHQGIFHEISYDAVIRNNVLEGNGFGNSSGLAGGGISVSSSPNVEIYGNTLTNNADGVGCYQQARGSGAYGVYEVRNLYVHDNTITMSTGMTGLTQSVGDPSFYTSKNNRFANNTYRLGSNAQYFWWMDAGRTEAQWKGYGMDASGSFTR